MTGELLPEPLVAVDGEREVVPAVAARHVLGDRDGPVDDQSYPSWALEITGLPAVPSLPTQPVHMWYRFGSVGPSSEQW